MTIADDARNNALHFEAVKFAYRQNREGIVVSFVVHPSDIPSALSTSHIGARYIIALVELGDDEQPKRREAMPNPRQLSHKLDTLPQPEPQSAGAKRSWADIQPAAQSGIRCADPIFRVFLEEEYPKAWCALEGDAAEVVRFICGVNSRVELGTKQAARMIWKQLDDQFIAWKAIEHA